MIGHPEIFAIAAVALTGMVILWANPHRMVNRVTFTMALHVVLWLTCVHIGVTNNIDPFWVRCCCVVAAYIPIQMWFLKEASFEGRLFSAAIWRRAWWWVGAATILALLAMTSVFVRAPAGAAKGPQFGSTYFAYMLGFVSILAMLWRETVRQSRAHSGVVRLELQVMLLGGSTMGFAVIALMAVHSVSHALWAIQLQPFVVLTFYASTVVAITTHRVFDARQILRVAAHQGLLIGLCTGAAFVVDWCARAIIPRPLDLFITVAAVLGFATWLNGRLRQAFHFYPEATEARQAAFAAARETRIEALENSFLSVLKGWGQSERAFLATGSKDGLRGPGGFTLAGDSTVLTTLRELRWVTPERIAREKPSAARGELERFLRDHGLGVLVVGEGPVLTTVIGVGTPASRRPFTYPHVAQLMELASIIDSALERAHFSVKAQHAEQLATVGLLGASLAHEIRNPLVSIKTFVQLLPQHYQDAVFREKFFRLIGDEVTRIDQLTEQLLDLASPRTYMAEMVELHPVLRASVDLVATKAAHRNVQLLMDFRAEPDRAFTDASAAKQVMLNLCFNAIQATESRDGERWVRVSTRNTSDGIEMAVEDSGPGIAAEIRPKLFQPFQTTKSTGFGLGLAICSDILNKLHATISVDPPVPGRGAAFRVVFPCQPLSS
jgi:signal transduction histidine kinase